MKIQYAILCFVIGIMLGGFVGIQFFYKPAMDVVEHAHAAIVKQDQTIAYWVNYGTNLWTQYVAMSNEFKYVKMRLDGFTSTYDERIKGYTDKIGKLNDMLAVKPTVVEKIVTRVVTNVVEQSVEIPPHIVSTEPANGERCGPVNEIRITGNVPMFITGCSTLHGFDGKFGDNVTYQGNTIVIPYKLKSAGYYSVKLWLQAVAPQKANRVPDINAPIVPAKIVPARGGKRFEYVYSIDVR